MRAAKCPNCGANISVDESKDAGICEFCNTPFITEKAISQTSNTSNNAHTIINNYYNSASNTSTQPKPTNNSISKDPRPELNIFITIFLLCFYFFPGIIYIFIILRRQKEWDEKHLK